MVKRNKGEDIHFIDDDKPEFNMMALYMQRMDRRSDERDLSLNEGDIKAFYRSTMTLLMNSIPRFDQKGMTEDNIKKLKEDLLKIGSKLKNMTLQAENIREKNKLQYEEDLFEYNIELNKKLFEYGLIYPLSDRKQIEEMIKEDF